MKDLIFIDIVVEHMQKLHKEITCESKGFDIMTKIGNQFVLKAETVREIMILSKMLKLLTGFTRSELVQEINLRFEQEMKEIDSYVNLKKTISEKNFIQENTQQFDIAGEQDVVSALKEFFKDQPNVHVVDISEKINKTSIRQIHESNNMFPMEVDVFLEEWNDNQRKKETQSKIKKIIPVINDNFILNKRLEDLKKVEQRLKKLPKSQRGELVQIQKQINTIKSCL